MAFFSEAILDPDTSQLVKNEEFNVLNVSDESLATVYDYDIGGVDGYTERTQPLLSDDNGMLTFWAEPGYYFLERGGALTLVYVTGEVIFSELSTVFLTNTSATFQPESNVGTYFYNSQQPIQEITTSTVLDNWPSGQTFVYNGTSDITVTFPALCAPNATFTLFQGGSGKIVVAATSPATIANIDSHTKTAAIRAITVVINVGTDPELPKYAFGGRTAA